MSHSYGGVRFPDHHVMYCEYDGTSDCMLSALYDTRDEVKQNWRSFRNPTCSCEFSEAVEIHADYGGGINWSGRACRGCKAIVGPRRLLDPVTEIWSESWGGSPSWFEPMAKD